MRNRENLEEIHTMPTDDLITHIESEACPCNPVWDSKNKIEVQSGLADKIVWVHKRIKDNLQ